MTVARGFAARQPRHINTRRARPRYSDRLAFVAGGTKLLSHAALRSNGKGADDPLVPIAAGKHTAQNIPGAKLEIVPGMGHDLPPGLVDMLSRLILDHCRAVDARAPARSPGWQCTCTGDHCGADHTTNGP
jgi:hypothetical protein